MPFPTAFDSVLATICFKLNIALLIAVSSFTLGFESEFGRSQIKDSSSKLDFSGVSKVDQMHSLVFSPEKVVYIRYGILGWKHLLILTNVWPI